MNVFIIAGYLLDFKDIYNVFISRGNPIYYKCPMNSDLLYNDLNLWFNIGIEPISEISQDFIKWIEPISKRRFYLDGESSTEFSWILFDHKMMFVFPKDSVFGHNNRKFPILTIDELEDQLISKYKEKAIEYLNMLYLSDITFIPKVMIDIIPSAYR